MQINNLKIMQIGFMFLFIAIYTNQIMASCEVGKAGFFPHEEYDYYMNVAREVNPEAYDKLCICRICTGGRHCIRYNPELSQNDEIKTCLVHDKNAGYPIIIIPSLLNLTKNAQMNILKRSFDRYKTTGTQLMTQGEREKILYALKSLDPSLHAAITKNDPDGSKHILPISSNTIAVNVSYEDGLPAFWITREYRSSVPFNQVRAGLAHEIGHYVLGHHYAEPSPITSFGETFEKAFSRIQEYEADRFAVIEFGVSIEDLIADFYRDLLVTKEYSTVGREGTFKSTHPLLRDRIKYLDTELRREVELKKPRKPIDWEALAKQRLQELKSQ